jgi:hypothetical protein
MSERLLKLQLITFRLIAVLRFIRWLAWCKWAGWKDTLGASV